MSDIEIYLLEAERNKTEAQSLARNSANREKSAPALKILLIVILGLESKELKLVELIESLGEYLNNDDVTIRTRSVAFTINSTIWPVNQYSYFVPGRRSEPPS